MYSESILVRKAYCWFIVYLLTILAALLSESVLAPNDYPAFVPPKPNSGLAELHSGYPLRRFVRLRGLAMERCL